jgi:hypothetical protein
MRSLVARLTAECVGHQDLGGCGNGHELDQVPALVPASSNGRMLSQDEAARLIRRFERGIPKRPVAASARRAVKRKAVLADPAPLSSPGLAMPPVLIFSFPSLPNQ